MTIQHQFEHALMRLLPAEVSQITIAYSGGLDSHVLLHLLSKSLFHDKFNVRAVHVNHGLSPNASHWQEHCERQCLALNIPFVCEHVDVDARNGGVEAAARDARYEALLSHTPDRGVVLLAQHQDDQLETFLLQLKRGAGPKGLASMGEVTEKVRGIRLLRPMLDINRASIEAYAHAYRLDWQEDESNKDTRFDRNFLRHDVVPILSERWPEIATSVSRSAALCAHQSALLRESCEEKLTGIVDDEHRLSVESLQTYSLSWQTELLRVWLEMAGAPMPSMAVTQEIIRLMSSQEDANPKVHWQNWTVRRFQHQLYILPLDSQPRALQLSLRPGDSFAVGGHSLAIEGTSEMLGDNSETLPFSGDVIELSVVYTPLSRRFKPRGESHSKPLKQWFKQWNVPPWQREQAPQIVINDELVAVIVNGRLIFSENAGQQFYSLSIHSTTAGK